MSDAAPRITAGYDADAPREWVFPRADLRSDDAGGVDGTLLAREVAAALGDLLGMAVTATPLAVPVTATAGWTAADGSACAAGGGAVLAAALLNRQCGGAFEAAGESSSPHAERCRTTLIEGLRDRLLPHATGWTSAVTASPRRAFAVEAGGVADRIDVAVVPARPAAADTSDWHAGLRALLDGFAIPVRLVLHDGPIAVRAARALAVGDVLPIATASEVGLRVGTLAWARGQVINADTGVAQLRIVARTRQPLIGEPL